GVAKGALTVEAADAKFQLWLAEKQVKISNKISKKALESKSETKKRIEAEVKIKTEREEALAAKRAKLMAKAEGAKAEEVETVEEQPAAETAEPQAEA
ncbi:MAG: 30S ribosomal protein S16, partial [Bacteroidetes bacterium]|nr:30S ribosomal protein S16 [Bacteroidota bacterium]